jgi:formylglycine-generating enzyme
LNAWVPTNDWHGDFPRRQAAGYGHTSPVGSLPNDLGLHDKASNVFGVARD